MSDLLERLRIIVSGVIHDGDDWEVVREAADEIERLRREVVDLRVEISHYRVGNRVMAMQAVLDAARDVVRVRNDARHEVDGEIDYLDDTLRALDGEVKP